MKLSKKRMAPAVGSKMKAGDLVQMKYISFWMKKNHKGGSPYTEDVLMITDVVNISLRLMYSDGTIRRDLAEYYEVISVA